ncbi:MAG: sulfatase [Fidelibacterota bacterium]
MKRREFLKTSAIASAGAMALCNRCTQKTNRPLNFVLLYSDELNPDYFQCYNENSPYPTPNLTELANAGTRFTNAYVAAPMCTPSRFAVLSGNYPGSCDHPKFLEENPTDEMYNIGWDTYLHKNMATLPGILSANGYVTGMSGKWHIGSEKSEDTQFPEFAPDADLNDAVVNKKLQERQQMVKKMIAGDAGFDEVRSATWGNFDGLPIKALHVHNFPWINKGTMEFLDARSQDGKPFFLYAATTAIHGPAHQDVLDVDYSYTPEGKVAGLDRFDLDREKLRNAIKDLHGQHQHKQAGLAYLDHHVGLVKKKLKDLGLLGNTVIMFMADHNVEPGKATCYERGNKVPFIVSWPGLPKGQVCSELVQNVDIASTIIKTIGLKKIKEQGFVGEDFRPLVKGEKKAIRKDIFMECGFARGVRSGQYKYIAFRLPDELIQQMESGEMNYAPNYFNRFKQAHSQIAIEYFPHYFDQDQLYDLESDPYEINNLAYNPAYQETLAMMKKIMQKYLDSFDHPYDLKRISFMESDKYKELVKKTQAIGTDYIQWLPRDHGNIIYPPKN